MTVRKTLFLNKNRKQKVRLKSSAFNFDKQTSKIIFSYNFVNKLEKLNDISKQSDSFELLHNIRTVLIAQISLLEKRLLFFSSEPLNDACKELKKIDIKILCQINDYMIKNLLIT